jgi:SAM-dependent MidA family methyltransferase
VTESEPSNPALLAIIRDEIERNGPITFARFMALALYEPMHGYYRRERPAVGWGGADFLTAPEMHPIFGQALGRQILECRERLGNPPDFTIREYAAGNGALARAILGEVAPGTRYQAIEVNAHRRTDLAAQLPLVEASEDAPAEAITGVVIANELLDALPVHRVVMRDGTLRELHVGLQRDGLGDAEGSPSTPALAKRLAAEGVDLAEGQGAEISLGIEPWVREVARDLRRGYVIVIDYGHRAAELYSPKRGAGTLLGYAGHRVVDDPYRSVGHQDLTAHVDFTAVEQAAAAAGLTALGLTTQAEFLVGAGAEGLLERARADPATDFAAWTALRSALGRLLDPRAMGAFKVMILGRDVPLEPPLSGLAYRLPAR